TRNRRTRFGRRIFGERGGGGVCFRAGRRPVENQVRRGVRPDQGHGRPRLHSRGHLQRRQGGAICGSVCSKFTSVPTSGGRGAFTGSWPFQRRAEQGGSRGCEGATREAG